MVSKKEVEESSEYEVTEGGTEGELADMSTEGTTEITHSKTRFPESKTHSHASSKVTDSELDEDEVQSTRGVSMAFGQHYWHCLFDFSSSFPVDKGGGRSFLTDISLYMETVQNLLDPSNDNISIVEDPKMGDVSLPGATTIEIRDQKSFVELLRLGPTLWIDMEVDKGLMFKI